MPTESIFLPVTTEAGHAARMANSAGGFAVNITHIAIGAAGYNVPMNAVTGRSTATSLQDEKNRVEIQDVRITAINQKDLSFVVEPTEEFYIREIGFYLADGTLYAVASHPTMALDWASPQSTNLFALEFVIEDADPDTVHFTATGPDLNLLMTREFTVLSNFHLTNALESLRLADRVRTILGDY